ncbi:MAG: hypothetical protein HYX60_11545, partial [Legionella longbeachae]|nr:hypothetical protein [Legionella longbeachae]
KYGKCERLDRILKAEGEDPNEFKIAKQPDVLMLFYLFEEKELKRIFKQLGYKFNHVMKNKTIQYYLNRTSHGSTLSKMVFSSILFNENPQISEALFQESLLSDIEDIQGGTTQEGIHLGVMVGTLSILIKNCSGLKIKKGKLSLNPNLPSWVKRLKFKIEFQNNLYEIEAFTNSCVINLCEQGNKNTSIYINNRLTQLSINKKFIYKKEILFRKEKLNIPFKTTPNSNRDLIN